MYNDTDLLSISTIRMLSLDQVENAKSGHLVLHWDKLQWLMYYGQNT